MINPYKGICSPCGNYLGTPSTYTSTWTEGQCVNCGRMEPVTELRDFGLTYTSQDIKTLLQRSVNYSNRLKWADEMPLWQTIIRKIKTGRVTL